MSEFFYVVTDEPDHDNSIVLGVFDNQKDATELMLKNMEECVRGGGIELQRLPKNRQADHREAIFGGVEMKVFGLQAGKVYAVGSKGHRDYFEVDPYTFDWNFETVDSPS